MKAKSIVIIREILMEKYKNAEKAYKQFRETMINKYKTDWINSEINEAEKEILDKLRVKYYDLGEALEEFEDYQW